MKTQLMYFFPLQIIQLESSYDSSDFPKCVSNQIVGFDQQYLQKT